MRSLTPKHLLTGLVVLLPYLVLGWFRLFPQTDAAINLPLFHFYLVTFITFSAAVIYILLSAALREIARPRHYLAAVAFVVIGAIFFTHGLATPGALIDYVHPAINWSAWLTLFTGGVVFALAALDGPEGLPSWLSVRRVAQPVAAGVISYFAVALFAPQVLQWIDAHSNPWHRLLIFFATLGLWLFAAFRLGRLWWGNGSRVDGTLAFVAFWMGCAAISMHQFPVWQLSWWLYHFILLVGFLVTVYILLVEYEQVREFRLLRYYLATSLIVTALIALVVSYIFAEFSYRNLVAEKQVASTNLLKVVTGEVAKTLPDDASPAQALAIYAHTLPTYPIGEVVVYDDNGSILNSDDRNDGDTNPIPPEHRSDYEQALAGETFVKVSGPAIAAYAPLYLNHNPAGRPIGVAITRQPIQEMNQTILRARTVGLLLTALSISVLSGILFVVVARADRIITTRTEELAVAYENLRQAEGMRDDLTHMIVHDLRSPLTIIYGSLGLVRYFKGEAHLEKHMHYIDQALRAAEQMTGLIDDILTVSKIEAGQFEPIIEPASVARLLSDRLSGFAAPAAKENKQLTLECPTDLNASFDSNMIGRVVDNLVSNALKYTGNSGRIQVSAWANKGQLYIRIRDDGEGIPDEYKQHIFGKFSQVPNAAEKSRRKGTGLGLTFCDLVVQLHGGRIWVEDAPGGGSDFIFYLPQNQNEATSLTTIATGD